MMYKKISPMVLLSVIAGCGSADKEEQKKLNYPATRKVDTSDIYFGTKINDPYRWLEDDKSDETAAWVKVQT